MKKIILIIFIMFVFAKNVSALELASNAKSAILVEATTGEIIYKKNENIKLAPASMTKIMSLILIMEEIDKGNLKWNEKIKTSKNASSMGGSQIYLEEGEAMSVEELIKGIAMGSANDAVVALAERISGSEEAFVFRMNEKAKKLGLNNTNFKNATGLDIANHYSSAKDMSIMARELIKYKKILKYSGKYEDYLRKNTDKKFWLINTNKLLKIYDGMDGLKTGYTKEAGYCLTATAKKNDMRLIGVIMGEDNSSVRNEEMSNLLNYGFNNYKVNTIIRENQKLGKYIVDKMKYKDINLIAKNDISILNTKNKRKRNITYKININNEKLPIKKGSKVGNIKVYENNKILLKDSIYVDNDVNKANIFSLYIKQIIELISRNISF